MFYTSNFDSRKMKNLQCYKGAVLLNKHKVQTREWLEYLDENWVKLTDGLRETTILLLAGRHGLETGRIGPKDDRLIDWHQNMVMFKKLVPNSKSYYVSSFRWKEWKG